MNTLRCREKVASRRFNVRRGQILQPATFNL
jgi:hypothetical protein